jgi:hypothetical protein
LEKHELLNHLSFFHSTSHTLIHGIPGALAEEKKFSTFVTFFFPLAQFFLLELNEAEGWKENRRRLKTREEKKSSNI